MAVALSWLLAWPAVARDVPGVVILNSYHPGFAWSDAEVSGLLERLREDYPKIDPPIEHMDAKRHPEPQYLARVKEFLLGKYQAQRIDLVVCFDNPALDMLLKYRDELFPHASIVFAGVSGFEPAMLQGLRGVTGVAEVMDNKGTIEIALALHPKTKQVLVISDQTVSGLTSRREIEALLPSFAGRVEFRFLPPATFAEAVAEIGALPADSIVLLHSYSTDRSGRSLSLEESTRLLTAAARVPVYSIHASRLGHGIVGGQLLDGREHGRRTAEIALRILAGEDAGQIPVEIKSTATAMFDYAQLSRFALPLDALPPGSFILNKPVSLFETHRTLVLGTMAVMVILVFMIIYLALSIMHRRRTEEQLRKSEARYRLLSENTADVIWTADVATGRCTFMSPSVSRLRGFTPEEAMGLTLEETLTPTSYRNVSESLPVRLAAFSAGDTSVRIQSHLVDQFCKDGSIVPTEAVTTLLTDEHGRVTEILGVTRDITERKRTEMALKKSQRLLDEAQRLSDLGSWEMDIATEEIIWSDGVFRLLGLTPQEFPPRFEDLLVRIHPDDRERMSQYYRDIRETGNFPSCEHRIVKRDGTMRWVHGSGEVECDGAGVPVAIVGTLQDITEKKRAEEERAKLESQLIQAQKMESIGRLAGGVAHDFNNMLSVVLGYAELIRARLPSDDPMLEDIMEIERAAMTSRDITRQLLAFSRKQIIAPRALQLNRHITETRKTLARLIGEDMVLHFHPGEDLWTIEFDPSQLDQILMNLSVNARDAMPNGGRLTIETSNVTVDSTYYSEHYYFTLGEYVLLEISDEGTGMDEQTLSHIFEPFFTTKELGQGTGLGLATVYGIIKQNGGFINAYSEPGHGTTFKIYFPRSVTEVAPRKTEEAPLASGSGTVLLVEDSEPVRHLIATILEAIGYRVLAVETPLQALSLTANKEMPIDLLITDVVMPGMNGVELRDRIAGVRPEIKVLFMSGYTADMIAHRGVLEEGVHFIQKPFSMSDIALKIRELNLAR
jgi:PAS domain S-box-containing protein